MAIPNSRYKLKQLILYVASKMSGADFFGKTKLNKVLYRADMACYRDLGVKLTDFKFQKNTMGPTLRAFLPITQEMALEGSFRWDSRSAGSFNEDRPVALAEPDLTVISAEECLRIDAEIERAWSLSGKQMSEEEHVTAAWFALQLGETIPPDLCYVEDPDKMVPLSRSEDARAQAAIERYTARTSTLSNPGA